MKKMKEISPKKWGVCAVGMLAVMVVGMALLTYIVDPYFHYHAPLSGISYRLYEQRYINDGISRHFEYDAVITGNSLSENFRASEFDELFDANSIKLPYSGAGYKELWSALDRTLSYNPSVEKVLVMMDFDDIIKDPDYTRYSDYPEYLYDDNVWNDGSYLWNKDTFYRGTMYNLLMTLKGKESTIFDEYGMSVEPTGAEIVMPYVGYIRMPEEVPEPKYGQDEIQTVRENIQQNVISVIEKYPDIQFYLVYSPSSIARWCVYNNKGQVEYRLEGCRAASELLLNEENVYLYSFLDDSNLICNLNNYTDTIHYTPDISSYILESIAENGHQLSKDNYNAHMDRAITFFSDFDYRSLAVCEENLILLDDD